MGNELGGHDAGHVGDLTPDDIKAGKHYVYYDHPHTTIYDAKNGIPFHLAKLYKTAKEIQTKTGKDMKVVIPSVVWNFEAVPGNLEKYYRSLQEAGIDLNDPLIQFDIHMHAAIEAPFVYDENGPERIMKYKKLLVDLGVRDPQITIGELYYGSDWTPDAIYRFVTYFKMLGVKSITLYPGDWK